MRDPERIPKVLKALEKFWVKRPDLRLGQILCILSANVVGSSYKITDNFYLEDDKLLEALKDYEDNKCPRCGRKD